MGIGHISTATWEPKCSVRKYKLPLEILYIVWVLTEGSFHAQDLVAIEIIIIF